MEDPNALISQLLRRVDLLEARLNSLMRGPRPAVTRDEITALQSTVSEMIESQGSMGDTLHAVYERVGAATTNRSAAKKRPMTDADALDVLTGKYRNLKHKEAGEEAGLTYAQVYSCRCEYTFKEVHAGLRKDGWKNPWSKS